MGQPAEAGNAEAMLTAYYDIIRPETDSFKYLLRSGELGCAEAYYHLMMAFAASELSHDYGMPIDDTVDLRAEELKWAKKGAESNSIRAGECQSRLASYYKEIGNIDEYERYLKMAASNGNRWAKRLLDQNNLGSGSINNKSQQKSGCYIATAGYGSYDAPEVLVICRFRDESLAQSALGRIFIKVYYRLSPPFAEWLKNRYMINTTMRQILNRFVTHIENR